MNPRKKKGQAVKADAAAATARPLLDSLPACLDGLL